MDVADPRRDRRRARATCASLLALGLLASCSSSDGPDSSTRRDLDAGTVAAGPVARSRAIFDAIGPSDPFCTVAVLRDDEVVFAEAYGSDDDGEVAPDTPVDLASVSKQFTGVAIELLIDDGELDGSDLVGDLVPASRPATDDLTVDELLTHTSGLADYTELLPQEDDEVATQDDAVAAIATSEPTGARGTFEYSNSNYVLLAEVVEAVSGRALPEFLDDEVFEPLDLDMAVDPQGPWLQIGDGSIWTTPTELVTWSSQYWDQSLDGPDLRTAMFDPEVDASDDPDADPDLTEEWYGSGVLRGTTDDGSEVLFHDGSWDGYETDWALLPDEQLAAAVTCDEEAELSEDAPASALLAIWEPER